MKPVTLAMDALREAVQNLPANSLAPVRAAALANMDENGLPSLHDEDWRYTDLSNALEISNRWLNAGASSTSSGDLEQEINRITASIDANWLVIANGQIDLSRYRHTDGLVVERFSESAAPFVLDKPLADLNAALLVDGLKIRVEQSVEQAIGLLIIDEAHVDAAVSQACVEIEMGIGTGANFVEYQASIGGGDQYTNSVVALQVADDGNARYVRIQDRARRHVQTGRLSASVAKNGRLEMSSFDLGGAMIRNDVDIDLVSPGADVVFNGLYLAGDGQHIDNHTRVDHRVGPATSSQEYRGILNGRCRCVWNGKAIVHAGADGTDAEQANHNLLLSDHAEIDAKPELEIYADEVKCAHGTTVGQLDEKALFYLRSRGIDADQAEQMLTRAFAVDIVKRVPVDAARDMVDDMIARRLTELVKAAKS